MERVRKLLASDCGDCDCVAWVTLWDTNRIARSSLELVPKAGSVLKIIWPSWNKKSLHAWTTSVQVRGTNLKPDSLSTKGQTKLVTMGLKLWERDRRLSLSNAAIGNPMAGKEPRKVAELLGVRIYLLAEAYCGNLDIQYLPPRESGHDLWRWLWLYLRQTFFCSWNW